MGLFDKNENNMFNIVTKLRKEYPSFKFISIKKQEDHLIDTSKDVFYNTETFMCVVNKILIDGIIQSKTNVFTEHIFYDDYSLYFVYLQDKVMKSIVCHLE